MLENTSPAKLVEITTVNVDKDLPRRERIIEFVRQIDDPYLYKCGTYTIIARFAENGPPIEECLQGIVT